MFEDIEYEVPLQVIDVCGYIYIFIYLIQVCFLNRITGVLRSVPKSRLEYLSPTNKSRSI